jgi:photosystem II stability/assembly factor-like uncharacterized protein
MKRVRAIAVFALVAGGIAAGVAAAAPVGDALDRPALNTRRAAQSVLLSVASAGARVVAVGERGIVVLSDDNGKSWRQARVPVSVTLTTVRFADAKNGFAVGHGGVVLVTNDGAETWMRRLDGRLVARLALDSAKASGDPALAREAERLTADGPDKPLLDVLVLDAQRALVVGAYGLALATDDGGATWVPRMDRLPNPKGLHLYAVRARGSVVLIAGEQGLVLLSDDGGRTFSRLATPYKGSFFTAELPSDHEIVLAGLRGNAWRSTDRGITWSQVAVPMPVSFTASALREDGSMVLVNQSGKVFAGHGGALAPLEAAPLPPANGVLARSGGTLLAATIQGVVPVALRGQGPAAGERK